MSAFSTQTMELINNYNFGEATLYILMTIGFTILATYIGLSIGTLK
jgi:fluoride ion exporter CrcB/FEX